MKKKLTVKEILNFKGKKKIAEVYTHFTYEAEACELAGIEMIISSENNDIRGIRESAKNTFFTVGLEYGKYLSEYEILKTFNFDKYKFRVITCEHNFTSTRQKIYNLLKLKNLIIDVTMKEHLR